MAHVKVSELSGAALDWAVAKCTGKGIEFEHPNDPWLTVNGIADQPLHSYNPSSDWAQGGPIIERELIRVIAPTTRGVDWVARIKQKLPPNMNGWYEQSGRTPLTAAMRCYVASKVGNSVEIPTCLVL